MTRPVPDALVEAAAEAMWVTQGPPDKKWSAASRTVAEAWRDDARVFLEAALPVVVEWLTQQHTDEVAAAWDAAYAVVERQTDLAELMHFDRPSDFRKGVLTSLAALDAARKAAAGLVVSDRQEDDQRCSTCCGSGTVYQEGAVGVPGSGGTIRCPDCGDPTMTTQMAMNLSEAAKSNPEHPLQYAISGHPSTVLTLHTENDDRSLGERYNRCPTCEQWSPCDIRRAPALAADIPSGRTPEDDQR